MIVAKLLRRPLKEPYDVDQRILPGPGLPEQTVIILETDLSARQILVQLESGVLSVEDLDLVQICPDIKISRIVPPGGPGLLT